MCEACSSPGQSVPAVFVLTLASPSSCGGCKTPWTCAPYATCALVCPNSIWPARCLDGTHVAVEVEDECDGCGSMLLDTLEFEVTRLEGAPPMVPPKRRELPAPCQPDPKRRVHPRRRELEDALWEVRLRIPDHSSLCARYIEGHPRNPNYMGKRWLLEEVVTRVAQLEWLYEHTEYRRELGRAKGAFREEGGRLSEVSLSQGVEDDIVAVHGGWPSRWPWLPEMRSWSPTTHASFEPCVHRAVRAVLLCCNRLGLPHFLGVRIASAALQR